jgi:hypothetical protein
MERACRPAVSTDVPGILSRDGDRVIPCLAAGPTTSRTVLRADEATIKQNCEFRNSAIRNS